MKFRLYSERQAAQSGEFPPKQSNPAFSVDLRQQIEMIMMEVVGSYYEGVLNIVTGERIETSDLWEYLERVMLRESPEYRKFCSGFRPGPDPSDRLRKFLLNTTSKGVLDLTDLLVAMLSPRGAIASFQERAPHRLRQCDVKITCAAALNELDVRLREAGMIYRIGDGMLISSADDYVHESILLPALAALRPPEFASAAKEFDEALLAQREGRYGDAITKANHTFESTMKIVAGKLNWAYDPSASAAAMIKLTIAKGLIPAPHESALNSLRSLMESDLPAIRNKTPSAGHGAGESKYVIPEPLAIYAINCCAANIKLLVDGYSVKKKG